LTQPRGGHKVEADMRPRLSFANVVSVLALFVALGGSAYAFHLGKNSVGSKQLKLNAVTTSKIKEEAVTGTKIAKGTITGTQINLSALGNVPSATTAGNAGTAGNANTLGGSPASSFMRSDRFAFGTASQDPPAPQTLFQIAGIEVTTPGSAGENFKLEIRNHTSESWGFGDNFLSVVDVVSPNGPGALFYDTTGRSMLIVGQSEANSTKAIAIQCGSDVLPNIVDCFAQASPNA
jgi:hypothetical protein